ncbi:MAG TPA: TorF family putative porin [Steroidobacteraceae bacterium]
MRRTIVSAVCAAAFAWAAGCRAADDGWGGSLVATSDYVFRGISQTSGDAAIQGDLHYHWASGAFAGAWASNINLPVADVGHTEVNLYAGWAWAPTPDWSTRLSYVRYLYPDSGPDIHYDYGELSGTIGFRDRVFATVGWSPDRPRPAYYAGGHAQSWSYELALRQPLWRWFGAAAGAGYYDLSDVFGLRYWAWNATLTASVGRFEVDLARFGTDDTARDWFGRESAGDRWALTGIWRF